MKPPNDQTRQEFEREGRKEWGRKMRLECTKAGAGGWRRKRNAGWGRLLRDPVTMILVGAILALTTLWAFLALVL